MVAGKAPADKNEQTGDFMNKNAVLLVSAIDPTRAYSCIKYLHTALAANGVELECWCRVPKSNMPSYREWGGRVRSFCESPLMNIPKVRTWYMKWKGFCRCLKYRNRTIICHDLLHYRACTTVKRLFPRTRLILYFTEIYNAKHSAFLNQLQSHFERHTNDMDLMIECDYLRNAYRLEENHVTQPSAVILNTIPLAEVQEILTIPRTGNPRPTVVYSGGAHEPGEFSIILDALKNIPLDFEMDFYCFGSQAVLDSLREECETKIPGKYRMIVNQPREQVLRQIRNADMGIVYYDPEYSVNTKYAAPTKFFEYISLAIPVISSGNPSLTSLIDRYGLGAYMKTNDAAGMQEALYTLLSQPELCRQASQNEASAFAESLCYEKQSEDAVGKILALINR